MGDLDAECILDGGWNWGAANDVVRRSQLPTPMQMRAAVAFAEAAAGSVLNGRASRILIDQRQTARRSVVPISFSAAGGTGWQQRTFFRRKNEI